MDGTKIAAVAVNKSWWFLKRRLPNPHIPTVRKNIPLENKKKRIPLETELIHIRDSVGEVYQLYLR